jgi:hypothetical protein
VRAAQQVRDFPVGHTGIADDHIPYRSVRLRSVCLPYKANADDVGSRVLDLTVSTQTYPRKKEFKFHLQTNWRSFRSRNLINIGKLAMPATNANKGFDFEVPSLDGEPSDRRDQAGILLSSRTKRKP